MLPGEGYRARAARVGWGAGCTAPAAMLEALLQYYDERSGLQLARDAFDVLVVYLMVYGALRVVRGTRAMQVGIGLCAVFLLYVLARGLQLTTVLSMMESLIASSLIVLVVVFQNDIRRGLMRVGSRGQGWFALRRTREAEMIDEVVDACTELARHRIGAIITFEQDANLDEFVGGHKGHTIDAAVTSELLVTLFLPEAMNKLHDGAVIIRDLRVAKAGVFFPMPESRPADEGFGSRHRAALGITEETDAIVVVVSEERGTISFCFNGNIIPGLDGPNLRRSLEGFFAPKARKKKSPPSEATSTPVVAEEKLAPIEPTITVKDEEAPPPSLRGEAIETVEEAPPPSEPPAPLRASRSSGAGAAPAPLRARTSSEPKAPDPDSEPPPPLRPRANEGEVKPAPRTRLSPVATPLMPESSRRKSLSSPGEDDVPSGRGENGDAK